MSGGTFTDEAELYCATHAESICYVDLSHDGGMGASLESVLEVVQRHITRESANKHYRVCDKECGGISKGVPDGHRLRWECSRCGRTTWEVVVA